MSFNIAKSLEALAARTAHVIADAQPLAGAVSVVAAGTPAGAVANVILAIPQMMDLANEIGSDVGGPQKLAAVKAALVGAVNEIDPKFGPNVDKVWGLLGPAISMIHFFRNLKL